MFRFSGLSSLNQAIEAAYAKDAKNLDLAGEIVAGAEMLAMDKAIRCARTRRR